MVPTLKGKLEWNSHTTGATLGIGGAQSVYQPRFWILKLKNALEVGKPRFEMNEQLNSDL